MDVQIELKRLRTELHEHNYRYYTLDAPVISDYDFDQLLNKLEQLGCLSRIFRSKQSHRSSWRRGDEKL
jgi:NAD-dependent DNA ligase